MSKYNLIDLTPDQQRRLCTYFYGLGRSIVDLKKINLIEDHFEDINSYGVYRCDKCNIVGIIKYGYSFLDITSNKDWHFLTKILCGECK